MAHYHIGHNMPGYLPESKPWCTDTAEWAVHLWQAETHAAADDLADDDAFLDADTAQNLVTAADLKSNGAVSMTIAGRVFWAEPAEGDRNACDLAGNE